MRQICGAFLLLLSTATMVWADQAVITFRSGRTQTIQLEESAEAVKEIRYLKEITPEALKPETQLNKREKPIAPAVQKPKEGNGLNLKWGKPIQGD